MKFRLTVEVDINFDLECDGEISTEAESVDSDAVGQQIVNQLVHGSFVDLLCDDVTNETGWCITGLSLTVPSAECIDHLD